MLGLGVISLDEQRVEDFVGLKPNALHLFDDPFGNETRLGGALANDQKDVEERRVVEHESGSSRKRLIVVRSQVFGVVVRHSFLVDPVVSVKPCSRSATCF